MKRKARHLNMAPEQAASRVARLKKQKQRRTANATTKRSQLFRRRTTEHRVRRRRLRPCCELRVDNCTCKPRPGLRNQSLNALAKRYLATPLSMVEDTTDVSKLRSLMRDRCDSLPIWVILLYAFVHAMFNQEELLKAMLDKNAFLCKPQWVDWARLGYISREAKRNNQNTGSSNSYSSTLKRVARQTATRGFRRPSMLQSAVFWLASLQHTILVRGLFATSTAPLLPETCGRQCCRSGSGKLTLGARGSSNNII